MRIAIEAKVKEDLLSDAKLVIVEEDGDGNCLYRAFARQLWGNPELHLAMRNKCMSYIESNVAEFKEFILGDVTRGLG